MNGPRCVPVGICMFGCGILRANAWLVGGIRPEGSGCQVRVEQRRTRILEGEEKLKRIEKQLAESEATTAATIAKANEDAVRLIAEAKEGAVAFTEQKSQEAISQAQQILAKAEAAGNADRERISIELKREFGRLVATTTTQVTGKVLTPEDQHRINEEALSKVGN